MSFQGVAEREFNHLTEAQQDSVLQLMILFNQGNMSVSKKKNNIPYGVFKGGLRYIAEDFDDTPEGFEEYI